MYDPIFVSLSVSPQCQLWRCRWVCPLRSVTDCIIVAISQVTTAFVKKTTMRQRHMVAAGPGYVTCRPPPVHHVPFVLTSTALATPPSKASPVRPSPPLWFPTPSLHLPSPTVPPPPASVCCCRPRRGPADRWRGKTRLRTAAGNSRMLPRWLSSACSGRQWLTADKEAFVLHRFLASLQVNFSPGVLIIFISEGHHWGFHHHLSRGPFVSFKYKAVFEKQQLFFSHNAFLLPCLWAFFVSECCCWHATWLMPQMCYKSLELSLFDLVAFFPHILQILGKYLKSRLFATISQPSY